MCKAGSRCSPPSCSSARCRTLPSVHKIFKYNGLIGAQPPSTIWNDSRRGGAVPANLAMVVDVVDQENRVVATAARRTLLQRGLNFRTVHVLLFSAERRLVLQRLSANHLRSPNRLGSSVAGYLYSEESYFQAGRRKLAEELKVTARIRSICEFQMIDEASLKFVGVFAGTLRQTPVVADNQIAELIHMSPAQTDSMLKADPSRFTPTFIQVYEHFKRWKQPD
jgi:isopentenyldiphosphate isomerase